ICLVPLVYQILAWLHEEQLTFLPREQFTRLRELVREMYASPALIVIATHAAIGALEELFFRGYLFAALRAATGPRTTILISALLFGLFHGVSGFDRLLPSTLMGLVLGWVCWRTGSVLPGMLLHACYNGLLIGLVYQYQGTSGSPYLDRLLLLGAAVGI